jgi:uncharacterized coiled-coil protein SlyX
MRERPDARGRMAMAKRYLAAARGLTPVAVREAAAILGETERTLRKQIAAGRYPLLAGPQSRERVLLPADLVAEYERRRGGGNAPPDPPAATPPLVRYAMTQEAVAQVVDATLRRYVASADKARRELREGYELRLAAQERTIAAQVKTIAELEAQVARAEARADAEAERHRIFHERLVAFIEDRASRSFANQLNRLIGGERE